MSGNELRGRPRKLSLETRMEIRRRVKAWTGARNAIYEHLAQQHGVSRSTIERTVIG